MLNFMNPRILSVLVLALVTALTPLAAQQDKPLDFTVPDGMFRRDLPIGQADLGMVEELARNTLSKEGKFFIIKTRRIIRVIDRAENIEAMRQMLPHIAKPGPNVKIEFVSREMSNGRLQGGQIRGTIRGGTNNGRNFGQGTISGTPGVIRRGGNGTQVSPGGVTILNNRGGGAIEVDLLNQRSGGSSLNSQFILVRAGNEGFIEVTKDIPMIDYFTRFIADGRYGAVLGINPRVLNNNVLLPLASGTFEVPEIRWEKAGSRLLVRPTVDGNLIHLEIMPQISAVVIVDRDALRRRELNTYLTGREQYVTYTRLATTVTVQNGQEVQIGGFAKATPEFNRYFYGGSKSGGVSVGTMTVKATIQ